MFYEKQTKEDQEKYKRMLMIIGMLSNLFSESDRPALYYRAHENCFCKYFNAINLARKDCSADAMKDSIGIGLKTWVGSDNQKVAEFGKLRKELENLNDNDLVLKVSEFRNERIKTTKKLYGINEMIYHIVIRTKNKMNIEECPFETIDISNIKRLPNKDTNNTRYFTDGKHTYNFNISKTTLYMNFDKKEHLDEIKVDIIDDPFDFLEKEFSKISVSSSYKPNRKLALKLYKEDKKGCHVEQKSGLNQWNASGRKRHPDEVYIPFNALDRNRPENQNFFPPRDTHFDLLLPDGKHIVAKVCQENGKAIMSNPNKVLGKWLLRDILDLPENTLITYELLQKKGFDTVVFEKIDELHFKIDFTDSQIYDELYPKE